MQRYSFFPYIGVGVSVGVGNFKSKECRESIECNKEKEHQHFLVDALLEIGGHLLSHLV